MTDSQALVRRSVTIGCCNTRITDYQESMDYLLTETVNRCVLLHDCGNHFKKSSVHKNKLLPRSTTNRNGGNIGNNNNDVKQHCVMIRNRIDLPEDLVMNDIYVNVTMSDKLKDDLIQYSLAAPAKDILRFELKQSYTAPSKEDSKFTLSVNVFSLSDGSVMGTFLSGTAHQVFEVSLGLEWRIFESSTVSNNQNLISSKAYTGGMMVLTKPLGTGGLDLLNNGKRSLVQKLAPIAANEIVYQIDLHSAEF